MLQVLHNDLYSNLNFVVNLNDESVMIIDDDLNKHFEVSFNPWEPEDKQLINEWTKAVKNYYQIDNAEEDNLTAWREAQVERSISGFKKYLKDSKKPVKKEKFKLNKQLVIKYLQRFKRKILRDNSDYWHSDASCIDNCILSLKESK